jgi:D-3-phosphoglycerate dehydrogenase
MKILLASPICPDAIDVLRRRHHVVCGFDAPASELPQLVAGCHAIVFRSGVNLTESLMAKAPMLRLLVRAGCGLDNIDLDYVQRRGIELVRIPGPGAQAVAEMTFALMLALARQVLVADGLLRRGHWAKHQIEGRLLTGKVIGIVGAGNIGSRVGEMAAAWGMQPTGCVEHLTPAAADRLRAKKIRPAGFEEVLEAADFLTIHVPYHASTHHLIGREALSRVKRDAFLVNLARGGVVDETALYEALTQGALAGAALDVHSREGEGHISPLAQLPQVILTPHIGAMTTDTQREIGQCVIRTLEQFDERESAMARIQQVA